MSGGGFGPSETVDITLDASPLQRTTTDSGGGFLTRVTIPASALPGRHTFRAKGESSGLWAKAFFNVRTDWPRFHFDGANSASNPYENVLDPSNVGGLVEKWSLSTFAPVLGGAAIVGGVVYVGSENGSMYALNAANGKVGWRVDVGHVSSTPAVANGVVYVSTASPVVAMKASTGEVLWRFYTYYGSFHSSPVVANGVVYVASNSTAIVYALDAATGAELWSFHSSNRIDSSPAVVDGVVYIASFDGYLYALDAANGTELWRFAAGTSSSSPAVADGVVYLGTYYDGLLAIDAATGAELWRNPLAGNIFGSAAVANGVVYVGSGNGYLYAVDAATGTELWSFQTLNEIVYSPTVANGAVFIMSFDNTFYAVDAATGSELWSHPVESWFDTDPSPAVVNGVVYVGSYDWNVYAFGLP